MVKEMEERQRGINNGECENEVGRDMGKEERERKGRIRADRFEGSLERKIG